MSDDETTHFCSHCQEITDGRWIYVRSLSVSPEQVYCCETCAELTHPDCEE